jgi:isoquinoline 1-oxidoreductase beta subunit
MLLGGSFGRKIETEAAEQAAILALRMKRPVQLMWSRGEDIARDRFRPPARARLAARMRRNGQLLGWRARIAAPATFAELSARLMPRMAGGNGAEAAAVEGAVPPYVIPALAVDHHPADIGVSTGMWRGVAHSYTAFFTECFVDELAHVANIEPLSFRMQMLGGSRRLAHCLSTVTALGGWEGGVPGSGQGIACHSVFGSHVAMLAEVHVGGAGVVVDRIVAVVDCGRTINDDIVLQQIEGGILWGMAATRRRGSPAASRTRATSMRCTCPPSPPRRRSSFASSAAPSRQAGWGNLPCRQSPQPSPMPCSPPPAAATAACH